eukprot:7130579-Lingulodinium_polyedra.AAC.1
MIFLRWSDVESECAPPPPSGGSRTRRRRKLKPPTDSCENWANHTSVDQDAAPNETATVVPAPA